MKREFIDKIISATGLAEDEKSSIQPAYVDGYDHGHLLAADILKNRQEYERAKSLADAVMKLLYRFEDARSARDRLYIAGAVQGLCWVLFDCPDGPEEALKVQAERRIGGPRPPIEIV